MDFAGLEKESGDITYMRPAQDDFLPITIEMTQADKDALEFKGFVTVQL